MFRRVDVAHPERLPDFGTFDATDSARAPQAYLVPASFGAVRDLLDAHGVWSTVMASEERRAVERFVIDSSVVAAREFQGHRERTLFGHYERVEIPVPAGTMVVPMSQPLARLAFSLLEPRSDDGVVDWNVLDRQLDGAAYYPILREPPER